MRSRSFLEIDVFSALPYRGNALAVVADAGDLTTGEMQHFASWTNLSETTFLLPPTDPSADYRVRIFTPASELPFAGHPTVGSCRAWLALGGKPRAGAEIVQECGAGLVRLRSDGTRLAFCAPALRQEDVPARLLANVISALGIPADRVLAARWLQNGPKWLSLLLDSAQTVLAIEPDHAALASLALVGVIGPHGSPPSSGEGCDFEVRAFAAAERIPEDPVTGSLNAALAQWLIPQGRAPARYLAAQGVRVQRAGRIHIDSQAGDVWVGGDSTICVEGSVVL